MLCWMFRRLFIYTYIVIPYIKQQAPVYMYLLLFLFFLLLFF
jgi:hypothetical protein